MKRYFVRYFSFIMCIIISLFVHFFNCINRNVKYLSNNTFCYVGKEIVLKNYYDGFQPVNDYNGENTSLDSYLPELEIISGVLSGYGPDCAGCSGYLANGDYVGDGDIYYNDSSYGVVRIVAGDRKYPFGSIVHITTRDDSFLAIILDRGGDIGIDKTMTFDLLFPTEDDASLFGIKPDTKFKILRYGF